MYRREKFQPRSPASKAMLSDWSRGAEGVIVEVPGASRLATRLRELGVVPGAFLRVLRGGCPLVIQVDEARLCLRRSDAGAIHVRAARR